jgi:hypothetical protein
MEAGGAAHPAVSEEDDHGRCGPGRPGVTRNTGPAARFYKETLPARTRRTNVVQRRAR